MHPSEGGQKFYIAEGEWFIGGNGESHGSLAQRWLSEHCEGSQSYMYDRTKVSSR